MKTLNMKNVRAGLKTPAAVRLASWLPLVLAALLAALPYACDGTPNEPETLPELQQEADAAAEAAYGAMGVKERMEGIVYER